MSDIARIIEIVEPEAKALGFELVRVLVFGKTEVGDEETTLQIMAERPETGQLVLEDCAALSRRVSDRIDALEEAGEILIDEAYRLEVSSPGIDRPLTRPQDFAQWAGHEVRVQLKNPVEGNRKSLQGDLVGIAGDEPGAEIVTVDDRKSGPVSFALADIHAAKLVLTDRLLAASKPLDTSGFDEEDIGDADEADFDDEDGSDAPGALQEQED
ncbi:MAG: ribosome maturation protein RimP [Sphingomonadales bacterium]|nr:ribosome maturation protein RimP [Sphingomonadales bacterium]MBU3992180.1 ribosome maturation protein RimP [Alphaproteobacteria bacterium]